MGEQQNGSTGWRFEEEMGEWNGWNQILRYPGFSILVYRNKRRLTHTHAVKVSGNWKGHKDPWHLTVRSTSLYIGQARYRSGVKPTVSPVVTIQTSPPNGTQRSQTSARPIEVWESTGKCRLTNHGSPHPHDWTMSIADVVDSRRNS
ncbi:hypothetical protein RRG08_046758 [Elysia crispata]|uniref:Uncharacterized protein n=1 Tax=Elysia crispata TaxID=231223 RepID=A0AAE0ZW37_9GAST|nr:hypothetical protein RRG08_046758 [Elysia crispata]